MPAKKPAAKPTRLERIETVLRNELEAARRELSAAEEQSATWSNRVADLTAYIAEREAALKAD